MTKNEKIALIRKQANLTLDAFGERVGLKKSALSHIENGKASVTDRLIKDVVREFKISESWLRGEIESDDIIFDETPADAAAAFAKDNGLDSTEEILLREYLKLKDDERSVFKKYLRSVLTDMNADSDSDQEENEDEGMALLPFA